jgi:hypothetical protein
MKLFGVKGTPFISEQSSKAVDNVASQTMWRVRTLVCASMPQQEFLVGSTILTLPTSVRSDPPRTLLSYTQTNYATKLHSSGKRIRQVAFYAAVGHYLISSYMI